MKGRLLIALAAVMSMSGSLAAHHGSAAFDTGNKITLSGTVTQWVYSNPHLLLMLEVKGDDGKAVPWVAETQAPGVMFPAGYRRDSFKAGDQVTVTMTPAKNGRPIGRIITVVTAKGQTLGGTGSQPSVIPPEGK